MENVVLVAVAVLSAAFAAWAAREAQVANRRTGRWQSARFTVEVVPDQPGSWRLTNVGQTAALNARIKWHWDPLGLHTGVHGGSLTSIEPGTSLVITSQLDRQTLALKGGHEPDTWRVTLTWVSVLDIAETRVLELPLG